MKPFNLERALAGDKVVTRDGREVTQLTKFDCRNEPLVGVLDGILETWLENGKFFGSGVYCDSDLFMAPKTVKRWVNFYDGHAYHYKTKDDAIEANYGNLGAIAIAVPVEFEEGYGCE